MLKITSYKYASVYGDDSFQFPEDMPVSELLNQMQQHPFRLLNTDMISVIIVPHGEGAELLAVGDEEYPAPKHRRILVPLHARLGKVREIAGQLASDITRLMSKEEPSGPFYAS